VAVAAVVLVLAVSVGVVVVVAAEAVGVVVVAAVMVVVAVMMVKWFLALMEEHRLIVFHNAVLRKGLNRREGN